MALSRLSCQSGALGANGGGDGDASDGLATMQAWAYYVHLLPREVQSERTIMYAEAYALFGALFMNVREKSCLCCV